MALDQMVALEVALDVIIIMDWDYSLLVKTVDLVIEVGVLQPLLEVIHLLLEEVEVQDKRE